MTTTGLTSVLEWINGDKTQLLTKLGLQISTVFLNISINRAKYQKIMKNAQNSLNTLLCLTIIPKPKDI